uniref:Ovule protein n=1 Tax=Panagrellus redivivus TaxID=6233 RepID=A0A7E4V3Z9_PANRE
MYHARTHKWYSTTWKTRKNCIHNVEAEKNLQSYDDLVTQLETEKRVLTAIMMRRSAKKHEQESECNTGAFKQPTEDGQSDAQMPKRSNTATQHHINVFGNPPNGRNKLLSTSVYHNPCKQLATKAVCKSTPVNGIIKTPISFPAQCCYSS